MKCIKQTLKETVEDNMLLKLGEGMIEVLDSETEFADGSSANASCFLIASSKQIPLRIMSGDGYFTDSTFTTNYGRTYIVPPSDNHKIYVSKNTKCYIAFGNKESITKLSMLSDRFKLKSENMGGMTLLRVLNPGTPEKNMNFNDFKYSPLEYIDFINTKNLELDISIFSNFTKLTNLFLGVGAGKINHNIYGDIAKIAGLNLNNFRSSTRSLYGDLSKCNFVLIENYYSTFTWTERPSSYNIMSIEGEVHLGDYVDKMLIDQSKCVAPSAPPSKIISVFGNRTSASDSAVTTLKGKGYTIRVNGLQL